MNIWESIADSDEPPPIIAELSGNHNGDIEIAKTIIKSLASVGGSLIKLQTYTPESLTIHSDTDDFIVNTPNKNWNGRSLYSLYEEAALPLEWHSELISYAQGLGITTFTSLFHVKDLKFCEELGIAAYKIASQECIHYELLKAVAGTNKPIFLSTGMATLGEIEEALSVIKSNGCSQVILMKCTSAYPADPRDTNILSIPIMRKLFNLPIGFSDHTTGIGSALAAISHGARCIEKHLCSSSAKNGVDGEFSVDELVFEKLILESRNAFYSLGEPTFNPTAREQIYYNGRRSIFATKDIPQDERLTKDNIAVIRPNKGLHPKFFNTVVGMKAVSPIKRGTPIDWSLLK